MQSLVLCLLTSASSTTAQYASFTYSGPHFYGYNQQQQQQQAQQQQLQSTLYPDAPVTYNQQYPATVPPVISQQSVWSGAPIVVTDEANGFQQYKQQQQRGGGYLPIDPFNNNNNGESFANTYRRQPDWKNIDHNIPTTRAANHNYNNVPGYVYSGRQPQLEQLDMADSRQDEEQIVRIGGSSSWPHSGKNYNNNNYYEPAQLLQRREFEAKYQYLFAEYLRKYPQRLQPLSNTAAPFVDK